MEKSNHQITWSECSRLLNEGKGYVHVKYIDSIGEKRTAYPESLEEALRIKKLTGSGYSIWYDTPVGCKQVIHDDGSEI